MEPKDWMALVLAALALLVSFAVAAYTVRSEKKMAKMANYERVHEHLVSPQTATGRRALFLHAPSSNFPTSRSRTHAKQCDCGDSPDLWDVMNQAVAWYDTLGTYYREREVPRDVALRAWYHPLIAIRPHVYRFLDHRSRQGIEQPWDALQALLELTLWYRCKCRACSTGDRPAAQLYPRDYVCECELCHGRQRISPPASMFQPWWIPVAELLYLAKRKPTPWAGLEKDERARRPRQAA